MLPTCHSFTSAGPLEAFGRVIWQLLQDVQERLVFRAHLYLQSDILNYKPAPGDLAYPEKLEMMEVGLRKIKFKFLKILYYLLIYFTNF